VPAGWPPPINNTAFWRENEIQHRCNTNFTD
jgi:hypothetical protein